MTTPNVLAQPAQALSFFRAFGDFSIAAVTKTLTLATPVAGTVLTGSSIECTQAFSGTGIATVTISLGIVGTEDKFATAFDVFALGSQVSTFSTGYIFDGATALVATLTVTGGNINALLAGKVRLAATFGERDGLTGPVTLESKGGGGGGGGVTSIADAGSGNLVFSAPTGVVTADVANPVRAGNLNTSAGVSAQPDLVTGAGNTAYGNTALGVNVGNGNDAFGVFALQLNTTGSNNTANGAQALAANVIGSNNVAIGAAALGSSNADGNTAVGANAAATLTTGTINTIIGNNADVSANNLTNSIAIGAGAIVAASNTVQLGDADVVSAKVGVDNIQLGNTVVTTAQFDKTNDTTLADIPGLSVNVAAAGVYTFEAALFTTSNVGTGVKAAINGTCTATSIIYEGDTVAAGVITQTRTTTKGNAVGGVTAITAGRIDITGTIVVNAAGTLTVQFAENAGIAATTSSVLVNSKFTVTRVA